MARTMPPEVRHAAGELLTGAVTDDDRRYLRGILGLLEGLDLTRTQAAAVSDRLVAVTTLANILVRGLVPQGARSELPKMIQFATDNMTAWDVLAEVTDGPVP